MPTPGKRYVCEKKKLRGEEGIEEMEEEKDKRETRAQGDLLLMKNKYTTHADELFFPSSSLLNLASPLPPVLEHYPSRFRSICNSNAHTYVCIHCICVYTRAYTHIYTYIYVNTAVQRNIRFFHLCSHIRYFASYNISACKCANY